MQAVAQTIHESITLIIVLLVACGLLAGWLIFHTLRAAETRGEMVRLRRKLADLELERANSYANRPGSSDVFLDPVVLTPRWITKGNAATTTDGGCLLIIDDVAHQAHTAVVTLRVDGIAIHIRHRVHAGHGLHAEGSMGTYTVQISAVEPLRAMVAISLRNRHAQAAS